jgi:hypothetical protein
MEGIKPLEEGAERFVREHLELRLKFASTVAAKVGIPLSEAVSEYTDIRQLIFNARPPAEKSEEWSKWLTYLNNLNASNDPNSMLSETHSTYKELSAYRQSLPPMRQFGIFDFGYDDADKSINLGFSEIQVQKRADEPSPLSPERRPELINELREMFAHIKQQYPDAKIVRGESWLYNLRSYRSLFPAEYTTKLDDSEGFKESIANGNFNRMRWWGQFIDRTGAVNEDRKNLFLANLEHLDPQNVGAAFPYKALRVSGDIQKFYDLFLPNPENQ